MSTAVATSSQFEIVDSPIQAGNEVIFVDAYSNPNTTNSNNNGSNNNENSNVQPTTNNDTLSVQNNGSNNNNKNGGLESDDEDSGDDDLKLPTLQDGNSSIPDDEDENDGSDDEKEAYMDEWQCPTCTLIQHISYRICDACGTAAPKLSPWQENMITEWDNMGDCVFYDTIMDICDNNYNINLEDESDFNAFMAKLESLGIKSDHSKSRALVMLEMVIAQNSDAGNSILGIKGNKHNYNYAKEKVKNALNKGLSLKQWMKHNEIWEQNLFLVLVEMGITEIPHHLYLIDSWHSFHEIIRKVRVLRKKDLKSSEAQQRLDKLCTKFEKLWKQETGFKLTSIKPTNSHRNYTANNLPKNVFVTSNERKEKKKQLKKAKKNFRKKKHAKTQSEELLEQKGRILKGWMKKNSIWQLALYQELLTTKSLQKYLTDPQKMLKHITETMFDQIVRKVRVERFSQLKDTKSRLQCDKILLKFEKLWRKQSGIKKTSIKKK